MTQAPREFILTLISNDPDWIRPGDEAGIERIGLDIERLGKLERQGHIHNARISSHTLDDLKVVTSLVRKARPFVRLNRPHPETRDEIERALALGAGCVMLPGFRLRDEAARFIEWVDGRAETVLLLETATAVDRLRDFISLPGVEEIMIGMNDLSLELNLAGPMGVAASDLMRRLSGEIRGAGIRFGFGGVARPEMEDLPVPADLVLAGYARLGAGSAWIARSFFQGGLGPEQFGEAIMRLRARLQFWFEQPPEILEEAGEKLRAIVRKL
ncbi:MAG: aldolase/citrate lyase family protein [Methylacidiphilales bacterium]|nr:aldolase/citrate lyase family protein [Candidatus Methylacidiphilales bacterium]